MVAAWICRLWSVLDSTLAVPRILLQSRQRIVYTHFESEMRQDGYIRCHALPSVDNSPPHQTTHTTQNKQSFNFPIFFLSLFPYLSFSGTNCLTFSIATSN